MVWNVFLIFSVWKQLNKMEHSVDNTILSAIRIMLSGNRYEAHISSPSSLPLKLFSPAWNISERHPCPFHVLPSSFVCHLFITSSSASYAFRCAPFPSTHVFQFPLPTLLLPPLYHYYLSFAHSYSSFLPLCCLWVSDPGSVPKGILSSFRLN